MLVVWVERIEYRHSICIYARKIKDSFHRIAYPDKYDAKYMIFVRKCKKIYVYMSIYNPKLNG